MMSYQFVTAREILEALHRALVNRNSACNSIAVECIHFLDNSDLVLVTFDRAKIICSAQSVVLDIFFYRKSR